MNWIEFKVKSFSHPFDALFLVSSTFSHSLFLLCCIAAIKPRHKWHLIFTFTENQKTNNAVLQATLHIFVHSRKFLLANSIEHPQNLKFIDIEIAQILKGAKHTRIFDAFRNVSLHEDGEGHYIELNVTSLVTEWFHSNEQSHGIVVKIFSSHDGSSLPHRVVNLNLEDLNKVSWNFFILWLLNFITFMGKIVLKNHTVNYLITSAVTESAIIFIYWYLCAIISYNTYHLVTFSIKLFLVVYFII